MKIEIEKKYQNIFEQRNPSISIHNYHFFKERSVVSSIHAKIIVCDYKYAYVGSGERRKNSFDKNFERRKSLSTRENIR